MIPVQHHRCWPCRHYPAARALARPACPMRVASYPLIGPDCRLYEYEPGADHAEVAHG